MLLIVAWSLVGVDRAWATATVSTLASATLSADTAGGSYTALTGPALAESDNNGMSAGSIILTAPTGFEFDTTVNSVTVRVTGTGTLAQINTSNTTTGQGTSKTVTPTATTITIWVTTISSGTGNRSTFTWSGIAVRPTNGTAKTANITYGGTSTGVTSGTNMGTLTEVAGAATALRVETAANGSGTVVGAQSVTAGNSVTAYAITRDAFGNFVANAAADSWSLANKASRVADGDLVPAGDRKSVVFTGHGVGSAGIHASAGGLAATDSGTLTVVPAAASKLFVSLPGQAFTDGSGCTGSPLPQMAGTPFTLALLTATDPFTNIAASYSGTQTISYSGPGGSPTYTTSVAFSSGQSTTTLTTTLTKAETTSITATSAGLTGVASSSLTVNPDAFTKLQLLLPGETAAPGTATGMTGSPAAQMAGIAFIAAVRAVDANWNVVSTVSDFVGITSSDPAASLPANAAFANGSITFTAILQTLGSQTITATDLSDGSKAPNTSPLITVIPSFSDNSTLVRRFDRTVSLTNSPILVTVSYTNLSSAALHGFCYADQVPSALAVTTLRVRLNGQDLTNYAAEFGQDGDVYPGCTPYRWVLERPAAFTESNAIPPVAAVEIVYAISSSVTGSFDLNEFTWAGYDPDTTNVVFGCSTSLGQQTVTILPVLGPNVAGTVAYYPSSYPSSNLSATRVGNVTMSLTGDTNLSVVTLADGSYRLSNISTGGTYCVTPSKTDDSPTANGVTSFDQTLIQRHILGLTPLSSPYKLLAADVDGSGQIDSFDQTLIQRLILGLSSQFPAGLWRFVPADCVFPDPQNPWNAPSNRWYTNLVADVTNGDFVAIKLGDVEDSWTAPAGGQALLSNSGKGQPALAAFVPEVSFGVSQQSAQPGQTVTVRVTVSGFSQVTSAQFTLAWDPAVLRYTGTGDYGLRGLSAGSFGTLLTGSGKLTFAWFDPEAVGVTLADGKVLFSVSFEVVGQAGSACALALAGSPTAQQVSVDFALAAFEAQDGSVAVVGPGVLVGNSGYGNGVFRLSVPTQKGSSYILEFTDSLAPAKWTALPAVAGDGTVRVLVDPAATGQLRFYRVRIK